LLNALILIGIGTIIYFLIRAGQYAVTVSGNARP